MATLVVLSEPDTLPRFELGAVHATPAALEAIPQMELAQAICRHSQGDWGELDPEDQIENKRAFDTGGRLLSAYQTKSGIRFQIITESSRVVTTVLLPEEY